MATGRGNDGGNKVLTSVEGFELVEEECVDRLRGKESIDAVGIEIGRRKSESRDSSGLWSTAEPSP